MLNRWNHPNFVNTSPTLVIVTSLERSSWVATSTWKPKKLIFRYWNSKLNFDLCWRAEIMSSLRRSTSSYASPSSGEAYKDRQLTTNFERWVYIDIYIYFFFFLCRHVSTFHARIPKPYLYVCLYPEKRNQHSFVNISPTLVSDTSMKRSS